MPQTNDAQEPRRTPRTTTVSGCRFHDRLRIDHRRGDNHRYYRDEDVLHPSHPDHDTDRR